MTSRQIEIFLSLVATRSFTETAKALYMTQPAVSQQVQALEKDISCTLFIRKKNGLELTSAGIAFYEEAPFLLTHTRSVYHKVRQNSLQNVVHRSLYYLPPLRILPLLVSEFVKIHPEISLSINKSDFIKQNALLVFAQHDISVAFGNPEKEYPGLKFIPLYAGGMVCFLHEAHPLAQKETLSLEDLRGEIVYSISESIQNDMLHQINNFLSSVADIHFFPKLTGTYEGSVMAATGQCLVVLPNISAPLEGCRVVARPLALPFSYHIGLYISQQAPEDVLDFCRLAERLCSEDLVPPVVY